jgi:hypothetical protein
MRKSGFIYRCMVLGLLACLWAMVACKKNRKEEMPPFAQVDISVKTNTGVAVDTAEFHVFESETQFRNALATGNSDGAVLSGTLASGQISIPQLPAGKDYYVLVRYYDTQTFQGYNILYTNEESTYFIPAQENAAVTTASVQLRPQEGLITFYTTTSNSNEIFPLEVRKGNTIIARVTESSSVVGEPQTVKLRKGSFTAQAKSGSEDVCDWFKSFQVEAGKNVLVELEQCNYARVAFYASFSSTDIYPIEVFVGLSKIGEISGPSSAPTCTSLSAPTVILNPAGYSYYAVSKNTKYSWSGTFTLIKGNCEQIGLTAPVSSN